MWMGLLWIVGVYGIAAAAVYTVYALRRGQGAKPSLLIVCVTCNHEQQIEWYIRTFMFLSALRGRDLDIMVMDEGSTDETVPIVEKMAGRNDHISILPSYVHLDTELEGRDEESYRVYVLSNEANHRNIPLFM